MEFNGFISGEAAMFYWKNSRKLALKIVLAGCSIVFPIILAIAVITSYWLLIFAYVLCCGLILLTFLIPKNKRKMLSLTPNRIFKDEEYIVCVGDKFEEFHLISDASALVDYGEFYFIKFPFGKYSDKFICQKSLLTQGTLEEFEALFEGKIERKSLGKK